MNAQDLAEVPGIQGSYVHRSCLSDHNTLYVSASSFLGLLRGLMYMGLLRKQGE